MPNPNDDGGYGAEMHLRNDDENEMSAPSIGVGDRKAQNHAMPLHEVLHAMGHHSMAKLVKKHAPKQKMKISSMHISPKGKKGGLY